jgi:hypothetical protein
MKISRLLHKIAQFELLCLSNIPNDYASWAEEEVGALKTKFPNVSLKSFVQFKSFLDALIPKLIHKYILLSGTMKVCSSISPDFAEMAATNGFAVFTEKVPNHFRNVVLTTEGPFAVDLSYIQFLCQWDLRDPSTKKEGLKAYKELRQNPWKAIKIEKLPMSAMPHINHPHGEYDQLYDPNNIDQYDIEETEEVFPEIFQRYALFSVAGIVEDLKVKYPDLIAQLEFFIQRDPTKKYLAYQMKTLSSGQALQNEIADVIDLFHQFKDKLGQKDINQWQFPALRDKLFEIRDFSSLSKSKQKKELKENIKKIETQGAQKLYEDDQCELIYVPDKATACFYGKDTKWCITMQNANYFEDYQGNNVVFYYLLRKDLPQEDLHQKIAIAVQRDKDNQIINNKNAIQAFLSDDYQVAPEILLQKSYLSAGSAILNLIKQNAPTHPMGFLAKLNFKPETLSAADYAKNVTEDNKKLIAQKAADPKVLSFLAKDDSYSMALSLAANSNTPAEILTSIVSKFDSDKISHHNRSTILLEIAANPNTDPKLLSKLALYKMENIRIAVAHNPSTPPETLEYLANEGENSGFVSAYMSNVRSGVMNNPSFPKHLRAKYFPDVSQRIWDEIDEVHLA